ncbi:MAG: D-alanyl-D-alanine carboxypeptidase family protein [Ruminococcus sp.]|nr:D-alanyl-D-alanine carboxypeptidase family protein [Ruminococcus sp.]MDE7097752.1 D-alanyl-D-alanine carboxypeptidase family protein [Ruminococcus sp.]
MSEKKKKPKVRKSAVRILSGIAVIVGMIIVSNNIIRDTSKVSTEGITEYIGNFVSKTNPPTIPNTIKYTDKENMLSEVEDSRFSGYKEGKISSDQLSEGLLVLADETHPISIGDNKTMVKLSDFRNEYYTVNGGEIMLNEEAAESLNLLMADYKEETNLCDFVVYGTTDTYTDAGSYCPRYFPERATGNTIDLALIAYGEYLAFDGLDEESWIIDNCSKYGFVLTCPEGRGDDADYCPWHFRYVGKLNASIMSAKNMGIDEYVEFLKTYTVDSPYTHKMNGSTYLVYTVKSEGETTTAKLPANGNYEISGDNKDTYIISFKR